MTFKPLDVPFGPGQTEHERQITYKPLDPLAAYPGLRGLRDSPLSDEWVNAQLSPKKVGTLGNPSLGQAFDFFAPSGMTFNGPRESLARPILGSLNGALDNRIGNFQFDMLDLTGSYEAFFRGIGWADEPSETLPGGFNPGEFLQSKDIDLFGMGATGAPARLADYANPANWVPVMLARRALGDASIEDPGGLAAVRGENRFFAFQGDPRYWAYLERMNPTDENLRGLAHSIATDNVSDEYEAQFEQQIFEQIKRDQAETLALTSNNPRIDYGAKLGLQLALGPAGDVFQQAAAEAEQPTGGQALVGGLLNVLTGVQPEAVHALTSLGARSMDLWTSDKFMQSGFAEFITTVPFVGTDIGKWAVPITQETEQAWLNLTVDQRRSALGASTAVSTTTDVATMLLGFGGVMYVRALAGAGRLGSMGQAAAKGYDVVMKLANITMATGLINATANWALESHWEGYEEYVGKYVDMSRPISSSQAAGLMNGLGYFGSGTYGAAQAAKILRRGSGLTLDLASKTPALGRLVPRPIFGQPEIQMYKAVFGGQRGVNFIRKLTGNDPNAEQHALNTIRSDWMTHSQNYSGDTLFTSIVAHRQAVIEAADMNDPLFRLYQADPLAYQQMLNHDLLLAAERVPLGHAQTLEIMSHLNKETSILALDATEQAIARTKVLATVLDDAITQMRMRQYGTRWENLINPEMAQVEARKLLAQAGYQVDENVLRTMGTARAGGMGAAKQHLELLFGMAFDRQFARLMALGTNLGDEISETSIGSLRNLFGDEVDNVIALLRGDIDEAGLVAAGTDMSRIRHPLHLDGDDGLVAWVRNRQHMPEDMQNPALDNKGLADKLDEIKDMLPSRRELRDANGDVIDDFQRELEAGENWTIIKKPRRFPATDPTTEAMPIEKQMTGVDRAQSDFMSVRHLNDGTLYKSPWIQYPFHSIDQIELGNRGTMMALIDSATKGTRAWRIGEFQRASLHRLLNTRYKGLTENQINGAFNGMQKMASNPTSSIKPFGKLIPVETPGHGQMLSLQGWAWKPEAVAEMHARFPNQLVNRKTGLLETPDWNYLLAQAFSQSHKLNMMAGFTSSRVGKANKVWGSALTLMSEQFYTLWRFGLSPFFKGGEYVESRAFNILRGVWFDDPMTRGLILRSTGGAQAREYVAAEMLVGESQMNALAGFAGGSVAGSVKGGSAEVGSYVLTGAEAAIKRARSATPGQLGVPKTGDDLSKGILGPAETGISREYPASVPDEMLLDNASGAYGVYGDDAADLALMPGDEDLAAEVLSRDGARAMERLQRREADAFLANASPEQIAMASRVSPYAGRVAVNAPTMTVQPLRMVARSTTPQSIAPIALKPGAYDSVMPTWGEVIEHPSVPTGPALSARTRATLHQRWDAAAHQPHVAAGVAGPRGRAVNRPAALQQWADEYLAYRLGERADLPPDPPRWANSPNWQNQRNIIVGEVDAIGVGTGRQRYIEIPPEGQGIAMSGARLEGTPLTAEGVARMREVEILREVANAGADDTIGDVMGRAFQNSNIRLTPTRTDHDWADVDAIFLTQQQDRAFQRFVGRMPEDHPAQMLDIRYYDGTDEGLAQASALYTMERSGVSDLATRRVSELGLLDEASEQVARSLDTAVNLPEFRQAIREAATFQLGFDPGEPLIKAFLRRDPQTQHDQLVVIVTSASGRNLKLGPHQIQDLWQQHGLPTTFSGMLPEGTDAVSFLREQGKNAVAYERIEGTAGRLHIYPDPENDLIEAAILTDANGNKVWADPRKRGIDIAFGSRFVASHDYQPVSDLAPHFDVGDIIHDVPNGRVNYLPKAAAKTTRAPTVLDGAAIESYALTAHPTGPGARPWRRLDKAFETVAPSTRPATLYRSVSPARAEAMARTATYQHPGYMSTATTRELATGYAGADDVLVRIEVPAGERVLDVDQAMREWPGINPAMQAAHSRTGAVRGSTGERLLGFGQTFTVSREGDEIVLRLQPARETHVGSWGYRYTDHGDVVEVVIDDAVEHGYQMEEQLRDALWRFRDKTILFELPDDAAADAYMRLWMRGELPTTSYATHAGEVMDVAHMRIRYGVPADVANAVPVATGEMNELGFSAEAVGDALEAAPVEVSTQTAPSWLDRVKKLWDPIPFKIGEMEKLRALMIKNTFADVLKQSNPRLYALYTKELKVPHYYLTRFKVEDRFLFNEWTRTGSREDLDALIAHASMFTGDATSVNLVRNLYESEDWIVLSDLWLLNSRAQAQDAFTTHFFSSYRSGIERTFNHPLMGIYPLSWSLKAAREWALFLFNNRTLGLHVGMTPAVAIKHIQRAEDRLWAQQSASEEPFGEMVGSKPGSRFGSVAYIGNLLLPGDWSSLPFPAAFPIRDLVRGDGFNPGDFLGDAFKNWGVSRDGRLTTEAIEQIYNHFNPKGPREPNPGASLSTLGRIAEQQSELNPR